MAPRQAKPGAGYRTYKFFGVAAHGRPGLASHAYGHIDDTTRLRSLTEKEKQTLRLIVCGHDAKSIARTLDLSVHTINERLRDARRKMAVSSSREAARLLLEAEGGTPLRASSDCHPEYVGGQRNRG